MKKKVQTLCVVHNKRHILLGMKKRGFGAGRWNGFGGHVEKNETIIDAAIRELSEEVGIKPISIKPRGILLFEFDGSNETLEVSLFHVAKFSGKPTESDEMKPHYFRLEDIPYADMWPDDSHWLPLIFEGRNIEGYFSFDSNGMIKSFRLKII